MFPSYSQYLHMIIPSSSHHIPIIFLSSSHDNPIIFSSHSHNFPMIFPSSSHHIHFILLSSSQHISIIFPSYFPSIFSSFIELDDGKIYRKALYLMAKNMVSCRFSLKPIHWIFPAFVALPGAGGHRSAAGSPGHSLRPRPRGGGGSVRLSGRGPWGPWGGHGVAMASWCRCFGTYELHKP